MTTVRADYLDRLRLAYEEEVETEAYFAALAERMDDRPRRESLHLLAELERVTARVIAPLLDRHGLQPLDDASLAERGRQQADLEAPDWDRLMAEMRRTYPGYITYFEKLEADGPPADRARLASLPEHERAALEFLRLEAGGHPDCGAPLRRYLEAAGPDVTVAGGA
jgi:dimethylamine/trimethylamine dehydrogenase